MLIDYGEDADVLYVTVDETVKSKRCNYREELNPFWHIERRHPETGEIVSITIPLAERQLRRWLKLDDEKS